MTKLKRGMLNSDKKGLSPIIATLLLVAVVVTLSAIVFIWAGRFIPEVISKQGMPAEQACENLVLSATFEGGKVIITNSGNIPAYGISLFAKSRGRSERFDLEGSVMAGTSREFSSGIDEDGNTKSLRFDGPESMEIIPGILGEGETGKKVYKCEKIIVPVTIQ